MVGTLHLKLSPSGRPPRLTRNVLLCAQGRGDPLPGLHPVLHVRGPGTPPPHGRARLGRRDAGAGARAESVLSRRAQGEGVGVAADAQVCSRRCCRRWWFVFSTVGTAGGGSSIGVVVITGGVCLVHFVATSSSASPPRGHHSRGRLNHAGR